MLSRFTVPVLFVVGTRSAAGWRVFERIKAVRPRRLYLAFEPSVSTHNTESSYPGVQPMTLAAAIDWDCEVRIFDVTPERQPAGFVAEAIDWFFTQETEGIILEDHCLPGSDFFLFCQATLERYRGDERVMHISGSNLQFGIRRGIASYYFGSIPATWGWAGWSRCWKKIRKNRETFEGFRESGLIAGAIPDAQQAGRQLNLFERYFISGEGVWETGYAFAVLSNNGLCITPNVNLVSNLSFGYSDDPSAADAAAFSGIPVRSVGFPLSHPKFYVPDRSADRLQLAWTAQDARKDVPKKLTRYGRGFPLAKT